MVEIGLWVEAWQSWHRVIRLCSLSSPVRLRNRLWWISRFVIEPH